MTELNSFRENKIKIQPSQPAFAGALRAGRPEALLRRSRQMRQASAKCLAFKAIFEKKAREARADFEEANRIWNETARNFKWWQSLP